MSHATVLSSARHRLVAATLALVATLPFSSTSLGDAKPEQATVVFVCEHGSVKSVIAMSLFERAARERGLPVRVLSRGLDPDQRVPPKIAAALAADGFDVARYQPQALDSRDLADATRVVAVGAELQGYEIPPAIARTWNDVPPASVDYAAASAALQRHIDTLLDELEALEQPEPEPATVR